MSIAEHAESQLTRPLPMLPPYPLPDVDFDVVITVSDGDQGPQRYSAFGQNYFDLNWWDTMDQSKVSPVSLTARKMIGSSSEAVPLALSGTANLYNPSTQAWSPAVAVPTTYHPTGKVTFDPRSLVTAQYPWIGALGLLVWASAAYGVGLNRMFARTVVHVDGFIGYIN